MRHILKEAVEVHDTLNPAIWTKNGELHPEVEEQLYKIVDTFVDFCDIPLEVVDAHLVGSNASFNYNSSSDLDLHVVVNFDLMNASNDILQSALNSQKAAFNDHYDITIHGVPVEMYVEDINAGTMSNGIYSLYMKKWIKFPKPIVIDKEFDFNDVVSRWVDRKDTAIEIEDEKEIKSLINTAYMIRKNSLATDGEYGEGNLLFKELRSKGIIQELKSELQKIQSKQLSLEELKIHNGNFILTEDSRTKLIGRTKSSSPRGRARFKRRIKSHVANQVKQFNNIDMNKLFKEDILTINLDVKGETDNYIVKISFGGFLDEIRKKTKFLKDDTITAAMIMQALMACFNREDVYIHCSCPDWRFRFDWVSREKHKTNSSENPDDPQNRPPVIRNPNDNLGSGCKHVLLVLGNKSWIIKVASVVNNYIVYMKKHYEKQYADIIYPALFGKAYEEPVQLSIDDMDNNGDLDTATDIIDKSNEYGRTRTQFQKGNTQGIRFASKETEDPDQMNLNI